MQCGVSLVLVRPAEGYGGGSKEGVGERGGSGGDSYCGPYEGGILIVIVGRRIGLGLMR